LIWHEPLQKLIIDSATGGFRPERVFDFDIDYLGKDCTALQSNFTEQHYEERIADFI